MINSVTSSLLPLHGAASSLIGGRPENQDDLGWVDTPLGFLLVVCDGMGGGPGGKTASYIVKNTFMQVVFNSPAQADRCEVMRMAVARAEEALEQKMAEVPSLRGMGSTLVAILVSEDSAIVTHLGDSRCYRLRGSSILYRSQDHSLVGELVRNKALTEEQARVSPQSNVITRGLGSTNNHVAEIDEVPYRRGDHFVLCTDGVWGSMPQPGLLQRLSVGSDVPHVVAALQDEVDRIGATEGGHHDNHTLVIIEMNKDSKLKDQMSKWIKIVLAALGCLLLASIILNVVTLQRLGQAPSRAEYESLVARNSQLSENNSILTNAQDGEYGAIYARQRQLQAEIQEMRMKLDSCQQVNDSLQHELEKVHSADATPKQGPASKPVATAAKSNPQEQSAMAYVEQIIRELNKMKQCKDKESWKNVQAHQEASKKEILTDLQNLDNATRKQWNRDISEIQRYLKDKNCSAFKVDNHKTGGYYTPTKMAIDDINQILSKMEGLRGQIVKQ